MSKIDPIVKDVLSKYLAPKQLKDAVWPLERKGKDGKKFVASYIAKHKYLEIVAAKAGIEWLPPVPLENDGVRKNVALIIYGKLDDRTEWSIGEASEHNYKTYGNMDSYPYAMAEKRGKDRVILKILGLHGFVYSEEEADDFKAHSRLSPGRRPPSKDSDHKKAWQDYCKEVKDKIESIAISPDSSQDDLMLYWNSQKDGLSKMNKSYPEFFSRMEEIFDEAVEVISSR